LPLLRKTFPFRGALRATLIRFVFEPIADRTAGRGRRESAFGSLFQTTRQRAADAHHRFDDFIHRDDRLDARERELRGRESVHGKERAAFHTWHLDASAVRIANETERVL